MASAILPIVGSVGGFMLGGTAGAIVGGVIGNAAGNLLSSRHKKQTVRLPTQEGPRLADLRVQLSSYGEVIPKIYGTMRLAGNVIWATDIKEATAEHTESQRSGNVTTTQNIINYSYTVSLAIAICEGQVDEIIRIWADGQLFTKEMLGADHGRFNIHYGTEDQQPDDIIGRYKPAGTYPAYRGLCYVVFEDFALEQFGNRIPTFTFEIRRTVRFKPAVEEKIKEVVLIPGAGEFVYADQVHTKQDGIDIDRQFYPFKFAPAVNMHNYSGKANMLVAIEQMARTLPNLEWVALVVTWFATSSRAGDCRIVPKVEYHSKSTKIAPSDWQVAGITRSGAETVLRFDEYTPTYGGTPSDDTVIAICRHLKERGYKIMFYPMIFVDEIKPSPKPWRGRIVAENAAEIDNWFNNPNYGYNRFITHYASLVADKVDAFIIGSEMIGLTGFTDRAGSYPAVNQFVRLAAIVKQTLGNNTLVTYAADWSEYHHTAGGWFNLDPLWASPDIDFIGIDAYFPLTEDLPHSHITEELIKKGWENGEGWDYYWDWQRKEKHYFAKESPHAPYKYAWKNLEHWWNSTHENPDGSTTAWQPKMKPVWFTEFGFPSVDACSNQPNVFYDPSSSESFFPRGSKGRVNFLAQRQALNATLDYLEQRNNKQFLDQLVPKRFVWTYDARPFPFWPDLKSVWQDGILWPTGHWINGKLGISNLGAIVAEILNLIGLEPTDYDVTRLTDDVSGYIISEHITAREALEQLQSAYFFDAVESDGILKFVLRTEGVAVTDINEDELVPSNNQDLRETIKVTIAQELELPQKVSVTHIDAQQNYDLVTALSQRQTVQTKEQVNFSVPITLSNQAASKIADITLYNAWQERINYELTLPPKYAYLEPTDIIRVIQKGAILHQLRITRTDMQRSGLMKLAATGFNPAMYDFQGVSGYLIPNFELPRSIANTKLELIDAPLLPSDTDQTILRLAVNSNGGNWNGAAIYYSTDEGYSYSLLVKTKSESITGLTLSQLTDGPSVVFDNDNEIIVQMLSGTLSSVTEAVLLNGANIALIGEELVQFQNAELIGDGRYRLTRLLRGRQGTEWATGSHKAGERFILMTGAVIAVNMGHHLISKNILFKPVSIGKSLAEISPIVFTYNANCLKPLAPVQASATRDDEGNIIISWIRRSRINNDWRDNADVPLGEDRELYNVEIKKRKKLIRLIESIIPTITYSIEQQKTDFNKPLKNLTATIYQLSSIVGRGYGTTINL